jgi:hypothetical protein
MSIKPVTNAETAALALAEREGWPPELRALIERYPREVWTGHENLGQMCQFWLSRHRMFRELAAGIDDATARYRDGKLSAPQFAQYFAPRLQFFLQQLHAHHQIEDFHYFPIFRKAERGLLRGFDVLESDHAALHHDIETTVTAANDLLRGLAGDAGAVARATDAYTAASGSLFKGLKRHLDDEEDLIVPIILDRGEDDLGIGH